MFLKNIENIKVDNMKNLKLYLVSICYFLFLICAVLEIKRINNIYNIALTLVFYIIWIREHLNKNV